MKISLDPSISNPVFQQLVDQIHFLINTGELKPGDKLPSIRRLAKEHKLASNTVAKALRQLEFRGLLQAKNRSAYVVSNNKSTSRYQARGVSSNKSEVENVVGKLDRGVFPGAFCKITEDYLSGDPEKCNVIHADGSGTKSIIAYLAFKESGDLSIFRGIAQDSIVMNLDDLLCVGVNGRIMMSNTINRNAMNCAGEVVSELIEGSESFLATLRDWGVNIYSGGGETADAGDLTGTVVVDSCAVSIMDKKNVISGELISPDLAIIGISSTGQANYEDIENSGIGSNGLTSARHDLLSTYYREKYPETYDSNISPELVYCGPYRLENNLPNSNLSIEQGLLSPTRTYAPVIYRLLKELSGAVKALIHCSGGGQSKCLKFGSKIHYVKDNLFPVPPIFNAIQSCSTTPWQEMYQVFNMGHRMEILCDPTHCEEIISLVNSFGLEARQIGYTEKSATQTNQLSLHHNGNLIKY